MPAELLTAERALEQAKRAIPVCANCADTGVIPEEQKHRYRQTCACGTGGRIRRNEDRASITKAMIDTQIAALGWAYDNSDLTASLIKMFQEVIAQLREERKKLEKL